MKTHYIFTAVLACIIAARIRGLAKCIALAMLACVVLTGEVYADPLTYNLDVMGESIHFGNKAACEPCQQVNPGMGFEVHDGGWFVGALGYYDSYRKFAKAGYVGYEARLNLGGGFYTGAVLRAGYMDGSDFHNWVALPSLELGYKRATVEVAFLPAVNKNTQTNVIAIWGRYAF